MKRRHRALDSATHDSSVHDNKSIARSAFKVSLGSFFGLTAGLVSQTLLAYLFGAGQEMDAFLTALVVPAYLQGVLLASLSFVFIPAFIEYTEAGREEDAWALVGTFFWLIGGLLLAIAILIALFASTIVDLIAPDLTPAKAELAAQMLSLLILTLPINGFGIFTASVQNARDRFFWSTARSALNSIGNIIALLILYPQIGAIALAWGYIAAELSSASVTTIPVLRHGWTKLTPLSDKRVLEMFRLLAPLVFIGILTRVTPVFERYFASGLPDGALSSLGYATRTARIIQGLFGAAVATAIFPTLSKAFSRDGLLGLVQKLEYGIRLTLVIGLPSVVVLSVIATPLVTVLFERGAFDHSTTLQVAYIVPVVILRAVFFYMLGNLLTRAFYVTKDTYTVPLISIISVVLYIGIAGPLLDQWGYAGLAYADAIHAGSGVLLLAIMLVIRHKIFEVKKLLWYTLLYAVPCILAMLVAWLVLFLTAHTFAAVQLLSASMSFGIVYMIVLYKLDAEMAAALLQVTGLEKLLKIQPMPKILSRLGFGF